MRRVVCGDCGKRYDYDRDDFCPRCGSYNPPADSRSTRMEQELLSRFGDARKNQTRGAARQAEQPGPQASPGPGAGPRRTPGPAARAPVCRPGGGGALPGPVRGRAARGAACEDPVSRRGGRTAVILAALAALLVLAANLLPMLAEQVRFSGGAQAGIVRHEAWEAFALNGVSVSVEDAFWVALDQDSPIYRPGYECLAVSVWITGGGLEKDLFIDTPRMVLEEGAFALEDDARLSRRLGDLGVYSVNLRDYQWEDPLIGEFVFFLPQGTRGQAALSIREYAPGHPDRPTLRTEHLVDLTLPE